MKYIFTPLAVFSRLVFSSVFVGIATHTHFRNVKIFIVEVPEGHLPSKLNF